MLKSLMLFGRRAYRFGGIRKFWVCHIWGLFLCLFRRKSRVESDVCKWNYGRDQTHPNSATWPNKSAEAGGPSELVHSLGWPGASWKVFTVVLLLTDSPLCFLAFQLSHLLPRMFLSHFFCMANSHPVVKDPASVSQFRSLGQQLYQSWLPCAPTALFILSNPVI